MNATAGPERFPEKSYLKQLESADLVGRDKLGWRVHHNAKGVGQPRTCDQREAVEVA